MRHHLAADRYHAVMLNVALSDHALFGGRKLAYIPARFYTTFKKLPFAPVVGHERLADALTHVSIDPPRIRFLKNDRAGLTRAAEALETMRIEGVVRTVRPGTIMFPNEPFADFVAPFGIGQFAEVKFEHAFDRPMTIASRALEMRRAAGIRHLSDFSLRRGSSVDESVDDAMYAYIGGFDDTSNLEAGFRLDQVTVGTMAHYQVKSYIGVSEQDEKTGKPKHFQQICFERWLDANPKGTTLLLDTISVPLGTLHAIAAAKSSPERRNALKVVRIDVGTHAPYWCWYVRQMLNTNGLSDVMIMSTGDHDAESIRKVIEKEPSVGGFGVGTKLISEVEHVAGITFKLSEIDSRPTMKCAFGKPTLPGQLQVWRYVDENRRYLGDVISLGNDPPEPDEVPWHNRADDSFPLLENFWRDSQYARIPPMEDQQHFVMQEIEKFHDPHHYPVVLDRPLQELIVTLQEEMKKDENEYPDVTMIQAVPDE